MLFNDHGRFRSGNALFINDQGRHEPVFSDEFPLAIDCYNFDRNFILTPNFHSYLELTYVYDGQGVFSTGRDDYPLEPGDLVVVGNAEIHRFEATTTNLKLAALLFLPQLVYRPGISKDEFSLIEFFFDARKIVHHRVAHPDADDLSVSRSMQSIYDLNLEKRRRYRIRTRVELMNLLLRLSDYYDSVHNAAVSGQGAQAPVQHIDRLRKVFSIVEESYTEKIDLADVADRINLSKGYFCRFFRHHTGMSLSEYTNRVRIDKAKELLLKGRFSTTQVSYEVGFESLPYFYRVFRDLTGMSPGEFLHAFSPDDD